MQPKKRRLTTGALGVLGGDCTECSPQGKTSGSERVNAQLQTGFLKAKPFLQHSGTWPAGSGRRAIFW